MLPYTAIWDRYQKKEDAIFCPASPYGKSKLMVEKFLTDVSAVYPVNIGVLRYFNVVGADPRGRSGPNQSASENLVTRAAKRILGTYDGIQIFGDDYDTDDGTCVRDFIHVSDLSTLHLLAIRKIARNKVGLVLNCGYGYGYSVRQIIDTASKVARQPIDFEVGRGRVRK